VTQGPALALLAAALFGLATPAAKILVGAVDPFLLAGLFYLASGIGLAALRLVLVRRNAWSEAPLVRADLPWLAGAVVFGGIAGPVLLMVGLARTEGSTAALLLTLEGVTTALIAWFAFRENFDRRILLGMGLIVAGAVVLGWQGRPGLEGLAGPACIVGACLAWGVDNNLTRKVSAADPLQVAMIKGLAAGPVTLILAFAAGAHLPSGGTMAAAAGVGFLGYGVSLALYVLALRHLGTARTGAYFSAAPFVGAAAAVPLLGEPVTVRLGTAGALIAAGVWLHLTERHEHEHQHSGQTHSHRHVHDAHHRHEHGPADPQGEPHTHAHRHDRLRHSHPHVPDLHHTHAH
jgi:drug/metabolite transporter (DMT)-like permease